MDVPSRRHDALDRFLDAAHLARGALVEEVGRAFGEPSLIVATGSVIAGFGNPTSDLDLYVVVDRTVTEFPMLSYLEGTRIDIVWHHTNAIEEHRTVCRTTPWPLAGPLRQDRWEAERRRLDTLSRFALGAEVHATPAAERLLDDLRSGWLAEGVVRYWRSETARRLHAGRLLAGARPLAAAQQCSEAVVCAVEWACARRGELYFTPKWVFEKVRRLGDDPMAALLREVLPGPGRAADVAAHIDRCERAIASLGTMHGLAYRLQANLASGVRGWTIDDRLLFARWETNGVELAGSDLPVSEPEAVVWEGAPDEPLPWDVAALLEDGLCWLSVVAA